MSSTTAATAIDSSSNNNSNINSNSMWTTASISEKKGSERSILSRSGRRVSFSSSVTASSASESESSKRFASFLQRKKDRQTLVMSQRESDDPDVAAATSWNNAVNKSSQELHPSSPISARSPSAQAEVVTREKYIETNAKYF